MLQINSCQFNTGRQPVWNSADTQKIGGFSQAACGSLATAINGLQHRSFEVICSSCTVADSFFSVPIKKCRGTCGISKDQYQIRGPFRICLHVLYIVSNEHPKSKMSDYGTSYSYTMCFYIYIFIYIPNKEKKSSNTSCFSN